MKILLLGKNGQVGWELQRSLAPLGEVHAFDVPEVDLAQLENLRQLVAEINPAVVVNAAAYTLVDKAESEPDVANRVNGEAVGVLAQECLRLGALMVHYSTDYVFNGTGTRPWIESDATDPVNAYGRSKCMGEKLLQQSGCDHLLMRTSWVYAPRGNNFVRTILRLAGERDSLRVIDDQFGAPTHAELLADVTALAVKRMHSDSNARARLCGTYHLVPRGEVSWYGLAKFVVQEARAQGAALATAPESMTAIATSEYPLPAKRPANSRMCVDKIERALEIQCPAWQVQCRQAIADLLREPKI